MKLRRDYTCPLELAHDMLRGKWKPILIFQLRDGTVSFSALLHGICGITPKMLLEQLGELQQFGLVGKHSYPGYPLRVEYFLTPQGERVLDAVRILQEVGVDYMVEHGMTAALDARGICYTRKSK